MSNYVGTAASAFDHAAMLAKRCGELYANDLAAAAVLMAERIHNGGIVYLMGNGGSAATCAHVAGELWGRFKIERDPIRCVDLTAHAAALTAIANDYDYESVFSRPLIQARNTDAVLAFSTSGKSQNVVGALEDLARYKKHCLRISFCGDETRLIDPVSDFVFAVPSNITARIQEQHDIMAHVLCELVEAELWKPNCA